MNMKKNTVIYVGRTIIPQSINQPAILVTNQIKTNSNSQTHNNIL